MKKLKTKFIIGIILLQATAFCYGQHNCEKNKIYGKWKSLGSVGGYENVIGNVDSLKKIIHLHRDAVFYEFRTNGTYTYSNSEGSLKGFERTDVYSFDEKTCQIILGTGKKAYKNSNLQILNVDGEYMIITNDNNPHGDYTTLYSKQ